MTPPDATTVITYELGNNTTTSTTDILTASENGSSSNQKKNASAIPRIVIAGAVRNCAHNDTMHLRKVWRVIDERIMPQFHVAKIIMFENDSTDNTNQVLDTEWVGSKVWPAGLVQVIRETGLVDSGMRRREERLAYARNRLWSAIENMTTTTPIDFVLMMDMDRVNLKLHHIDQCFHLPPNWGACCANQISFYYDLWPLRTLDDWVTHNVLRDDVIANASLHYRHISARQEPIRVTSCFGGAVLYRYAPLRGVANLTTSYKGVDAHGRKMCEHIPFHENIARQRPNYTLFIQPKFLNSGKPMKRWTKRLDPEVRESWNSTELWKWYGPFFVDEAKASSAKASPPLTLTAENSTNESVRPRIVIAGAVRNCAQNDTMYLTTLWHVINETIMPHFDVVKIILFENDSTDNTNLLLDTEWVGSKDWPDGLVRVIRETGLVNSGMIREERLAHARNRLWSAIENMSTPIDYVLKLDMDDVNRKLHHVDQCFQLPPNWGACCVNQIGVYYDLWALRTFDDWVDHDVLHPDANHSPTVHYRHISARRDPIHVKSCFGGAVLYQYGPLKGIANLATSYRGLGDDGNMTCEHISFHENIVRQRPEYTFFIQPKFLNSGSIAIKHRVRKQHQRAVNKSWNSTELWMWYEPFLTT